MLHIAFICCITLGTPVRVRTVTGEEIRVLNIDPRGLRTPHLPPSVPPVDSRPPFRNPRHRFYRRVPLSKEFEAFKQARDRALSEIKLDLQQEYDAFDVKFIPDVTNYTSSCFSDETI